MKNISIILREIENKGYSVCENFLTEKKCNYFINIFHKIYETRRKKKEYIGKDDTIVLYNYFKEDVRLVSLFNNNFIDKVMKRLIDDDYVLTSTAARNKIKVKLNLKKSKKPTDSGNKWHVDNRHLRGKALKPSLSYFAVITLDEFNNNNGSTQFIENSHKFKKKIDSHKNFKFKHFSAKKGSIIFIDSNLVHRAGISGDKSRWSIFNLYSPWFVKPYYQFDKIINKKKISLRTRKLLHFNSVPPTSQNIRISTLVKKI